MDNDELRDLVDRQAAMLVELGDKVETYAAAVRLLARHQELWRALWLLVMHVDPQMPMLPRPKNLRQARRQLDDLCDAISAVVQDANRLSIEAAKLLPKDEPPIH